VRPAQPPVGLQLTRAARSISRAFDDALAAAGGSLPTWLVLLSMKSHSAGSQRELAQAVGVKEATLTHHLNALETAGLITRRRDPANRRIHVVELTQTGDEMFSRLRAVASAFDQRLLRDLGEEDVARLRDLLDRLAANAGAELADAAPWAELR
jgi:MarR family transcriptional regulator, transcriptional regulator for hemolysin